MNRKGFERKRSWPDRDTILDLPGGTEENNIITDVPVDIRAQDLYSTNLEC
jgi:hypothetical protein